MSRGGRGLSPRAVAGSLFAVCLLLLGSVLALNLALSALRPLLPWLAGAAGTVTLLWLLIVLIRWRRSRW